MKILNLEKELEELTVLGKIHADHIDLDETYEKLDKFQDKVARMKLKRYDKQSFLKRAEEEKIKIMQYKNLDEYSPWLLIDPSGNVYIGHILPFRENE